MCPHPFGFVIKLYNFRLHCILFNRCSSMHCWKEYSSFVLLWNYETKDCGIWNACWHDCTCCPLSVMKLCGISFLYSLHVSTMVSLWSVSKLIANSMEVGHYNMLHFSLCNKLVLSESLCNKQEPIHQLIFQLHQCMVLQSPYKELSITKCQYWYHIYQVSSEYEPSSCSLTAQYTSG